MSKLIAIPVKHVLTRTYKNKCPANRFFFFCWWSHAKDLVLVLCVCVCVCKMNKIRHIQVHESWKLLKMNKEDINFGENDTLPGQWIWVEKLLKKCVNSLKFISKSSVTFIEMEMSIFWSVLKRFKWNLYVFFYYGKLWNDFAHWKMNAQHVQLSHWTTNSLYSVNIFDTKIFGKYFCTTQLFLYKENIRVAFLVFTHKLKWTQNWKFHGEFTIKKWKMIAFGLVVKTTKLCADKNEKQQQQKNRQTQTHTECQSFLFDKQKAYVIE